MEILKVENLGKTYGTGDAKVEALKNVSFTLQKENLRQWWENPVPEKARC